MIDYLIEWLNTKIDESLYNGNYQEFENYVKLKEILEDES